MFSLKSDNHLEDVVKCLLSDNIFSDIRFVAENASLYGHSSLMLRLIPSLANLVCEGCKAAHEKIVILLPGVSRDFLESALMEFYLLGDILKLSSVLNEDKQQKPENLFLTPEKHCKDSESRIKKSDNSDIANNTKKPSKQLKNSQIPKPQYMESEHNFDKMNYAESDKQNDHTSEMLLGVDPEDLSEHNLQTVELSENDQEIKVEIDSNNSNEELKNVEVALELSFEEMEESQKSISSISGLLKQVNENLKPIIASGLDPKIKSSVMTSLVEKKELTLTQSLAVIDRVNSQVFKLLGNVSLDPSFCRCLAMILQENIPETFAHRSDLPGKIGACYSTKYLESEVSRVPVNWFSQFKANFKRDIIDKSSYNIREAVEKNAYIENPK